MSYIPRPVKHERDALSIRLDRDLSDTLKQYAEFLASSREYVIGHALQMVFSRDKEFALWRASSGLPTPQRGGATLDGARGDAASRLVSRSAQKVQ